MGIFSDLGFLNQGGVITSPDCYNVGGVSSANIINNAYNALTFTPDSDGQISILGSALPSVISQQASQNDWVKYQVKATNLNGTLTVNGKNLTLLTDASGIKTFDFIYERTRQLNVNITGTTDKVTIDTWVK